MPPRRTSTKSAPLAPKLAAKASKAAKKAVIRNSRPVAAGRQPGTTAIQDYLEQIHGLIETKGYARVVDIAANLSISLSSVTAMIQRLDGEGLVVYEKYRGVILTEQGRVVAEEITQRHAVLTRLLRHLGIDEATIYPDVEGMEHHISPATLAGITRLVEELDRSPALVRRLHGQ
jgi:Mn-dependent DtxR family transcriptional regulator